MTTPLHTQKRKQNVTLAIILGALAVAMLLASLPMWKLLFGSVGGAG